MKCGYQQRECENHSPLYLASDPENVVTSFGRKFRLDNLDSESNGDGMKTELLTCHWMVIDIPIDRINKGV